MSFSTWGASRVTPTAPPPFQVRSRMSSKAQLRNMHREYRGRVVGSRGDVPNFSHGRSSKRFRSAVGHMLVLKPQVSFIARTRNSVEERKSVSTTKADCGPEMQKNVGLSGNSRRPHTHDPNAHRRTGDRAVLRKWKVYVGGRYFPF